MQHRLPRGLRAALAGASVLALGAAGVAAPAGAAKHKPTSVKATAGAISAKVTYVPPKHSYLSYKHLRLTVTGNGKPLMSVPLSQNGTSSTRPILKLVDVNGDGIPDPLVDTYSGGAHCCSTTTWAVSLGTGGGWTANHAQPWGDYGYQLKDVGGSPTPEFVSADDRFAYAFTSYAGSIPAIQIFSLEGNVMTDVTRRYPDQIRADIAQIQEYWDQAASSEDLATEGVQAVSAAWIADLAMLGDLEGAKAVLAKDAAAGYLKGGPSINWENAKTYEGQLAYDLKHWGYLADPTQIGLPSGD